MEFDYLSSEGSLIPKSYFEGCIYLCIFTKNKCKPCKLLIDKINRIDMTKYTNIVLVVISMDQNIDEWSQCKKPLNWLEFPFFPQENRKKLFSKFRVNYLPFITVADDNTWLNIERQDVIGRQDKLQTAIEYCISCFNVENFEII